MPSFIGYPADRGKTGKAAIDAVHDAKVKLDASKTYRKNLRENLWKQSEKQYEGDHWSMMSGPKDPDSDQITINMSFSTVNTIVPFVTGSAPSFIVQPHSGDATVLNASLQQAYLNRIWGMRAIRAQESLESSTVDMLIYGDGYILTGYDIEEKRNEDGEYDDVASLWVDKLSPWDVWIDPSSDGIHNARWVVRRFKISLEELKNDKRYFNKNKSNITLVTDQSPRDERTKSEQVNLFDVEDGSELVELYEFYDIVHRRMIVFSEDSLYPLRWIEEVDEVPIVQQGNYPITNSPYHIGELEQIWPMQQELNLARSEQATHRRRHAAKVIARKGSFDDEAIAALKSDAVLEVVLLDTNEPLHDVAQPLQIPNLSADTYAIADVAQRDMYEVSGVNEYQRGATPAVQRTATEATIIEGSSAIKTAHKLRIVERAAQQVGRHLLLIGRDVFEVTETDEWELWFTGRESERILRAELGQAIIDGQAEGLTPEQIQETLQSDAKMSPGDLIWEGEYEVIVERSSTELRNPVMKEQRAREMLIQTVNMFEVLAVSGVTVNLKRLYEMWLEAAGVDDIDAVFEPPGQAQGALAQGGPQLPVGQNQPPGSPNTQSAGPPAAPVTDQNSGALPPAEGTPLGI